jgi:hypothetical protein
MKGVTSTIFDHFQHLYFFYRWRTTLFWVSMVFNNHSRSIPQISHAGTSTGAHFGKSRVQISLTAFLVYFHLYDPTSWRFYCSMVNQYFQYQCRSTKKGYEEYFTLNNRLWSNTTTWNALKSIKICDRWWECCWRFMNIYAHQEIEHLFDGLICKDALRGVSPWRTSQFRCMQCIYMTTFITNDYLRLIMVRYLESNDVSNAAKDAFLFIYHQDWPSEASDAIWWTYWVTSHSTYGYFTVK